MIYSLNDKNLLRYYTGPARVSLVWRLAYIKFVLSLRTRDLNALRAKGKTFERLEFIDKIRTYFVVNGVPLSGANVFLKQFGFT